MSSTCDTCLYYEYDEDYECYTCMMDLDEDEYFIADLIDMQVVLEDGTEFGTLTDVMETGANDVYCVQTEKYGEVLIPAIKDCILDVDIENGKMMIHLMPGLIDEPAQK